MAFIKNVLSASVPPEVKNISDDLQFNIFEVSPGNVKIIQ